MSQSFKNRLNALRQTHSYQVEKTKLEFVRGVTRLMKLKGINNADLALKIDTSNAYITKALRGDSNFTIDSMVKLASAVGAKLHIHVADTNATVRWLEAHPCVLQAQDEDIGKTLQPSHGRSNVFDMKGIFAEISNEKSQLFA